MANPTMPAGTDMGTWYDVTTNSEGCVTELRLINNRLNGSLPPEIGNLSSLTDLILFFNHDLTGILLSEIGDLTNLKALDLLGCGFTGNIPPEIGNLKSAT